MDIEEAIEKACLAGWGVPNWWAQRDAGMIVAALRENRGISKRQLADEARMHPSLVTRLEAGGDAKLSTIRALFDALGYTLVLIPRPQCEEAQDLLQEEAARRRARMVDNLRQFQVYADASASPVVAPAQIRRKSERLNAEPPPRIAPKQQSGRRTKRKPPRRR